jgi:hydroxymethylglutaryl-CoA lyase
MAFPASVTLCECWARDGLQSVPRVVSTEDKVEMIDRTLDAGVRRLEVTSFSHPKLLPQFADCEEVLRRIDRRPGVTYVVLMPNAKGWERCKRCQEEGYGADDIILMISSSEAHNTVNFRMTHDEAKAAHAAIIREAHELGVRITGCTGTVYGCPISGDVPMEKVVDITRFYLDEGVQTLMLGDTTGAANPLLVRERVGELQSLFPDAEFIAHFHDTRGNGIVNSVAALELGLRFVDTSLGAIGGQPSTSASKYQLGFTGNTCTEDLVCLLEEMGVDTGIDVERMIANGLRAEEILGERLRANVIRSGRVNHRPRDYDPSRPLASRAEAASGS